MKKKRIAFSILIVVLLCTFVTSSLAVGTLATESLSAAYSSSAVRYYVNTKATAAKNSSQSWLIIFDSNQYSYFYPEGNSGATIEGYHHTYLVNASGNYLTSSYKRVLSGGSFTFGPSDMDKDSSSNTVKLQLCNPNTEMVLTTKGGVVAYTD